ncbi:hypothetical protein [Phenylobacterium sp.]|jgi:hypothetical protein|uniref:hypothetical protein n=1 Tax=Phenylobacterium sp. TaxID=1871053 RepID=UPI002F41729A
MTPELLEFARRELARPAPPAAAAAAEALAPLFPEAAAVLFYGSALRTGDRDGVLDFYVLTRRPPEGWRGLPGRMLWPDVSYHEVAAADGLVRAKVAAMTLARFQRAARGTGADTTVWTRFVQPAVLVWSQDAAAAAAVQAAVADAAAAAAGYAAALGPERGPAQAYWSALFRQTYAAEFRVEPSGRERSLIEADPERYDGLLPLAWAAGGLRFETAGEGVFAPQLTVSDRTRRLRAWRLRRALGRPLNLARLAKAAFTFEGAARYAAWKIERHTGVAVPMTPWRERHPILSAPALLWALWRRRSASG